jgi:hypothetical protein
MFPKTPHHLKAFHTKLEKRRNERETMRQLTSILPDDGVISTAVASQAVTEMRESIQRQNTTMSILQAQRSAP